MNTNVILGKREKEILERIAWGASYKEAAAFFHISWRTVDNTLRKIKEKIGLNKVTELTAWWFCTTYNISFDLSPLAKQTIASVLLCLFFIGETAMTSDSYSPVWRFKRTRTEYRSRRQETSINHPYII